MPDDFNTAQALNRLTSCREAHRVGYCEKLFRMQRQAIRSPQIQAIYDLLRETYRWDLENYRGKYEEMEAHYQDAHKMKKLRIQARNELLFFGTVADPCYVQEIQATFKIEICKPNKYGRLYANLGIYSSLQGATLTSMLKEVLAANVINVHGGTIIFVKSPSTQKLRQAFHHLIDPPGRFYAVVFSDDSCLSVRTATGVQRFNLDISSCDLSHGAVMFEQFIKLMPAWLQEEVDLLVEQCRQNVVVRSRANPKNKVILHPVDPFLPSGSVLTTIFNTINVMIIISHIMSVEFLGGDTIIQQSEQVGYIMTVEDASAHIEQLQFLKHSPCMDADGEYQPLLNLGVILRASGRCQRDLPGSGAIEQRARAFQAALLQGAYPYVAFPFIDNMKIAVDCKIPSSIWKHPSLVDLTMKVESDEKDILFFSNEDVFRRYNLSDYEIELLSIEIASLNVGERAGNSGVDKIMKIDYAYEPVF